MRPHLARARVRHHRAWRPGRRRSSTSSTPSSSPAMNGGTPIAGAAGDCERRAWPQRLPGRCPGRRARPGPALLDRVRCRRHATSSGQPRSSAGPAAPCGACRPRLRPGVWAFMYYARAADHVRPPERAARAGRSCSTSSGIHALGVGLPIALVRGRSARAA